VDLLITERLIMFRVIIENKFRENPINLSRAVKLLYNQDFTGSIRLENMLWWKKYFLKVIHLPILYPKRGYIQIVKVYRDKRPSIRVVTIPATTSSDKRELLVLNKIYGGDNG
jgi:hypothetical protein